LHQKVSRGERDTALLVLIDGVRAVTEFGSTSVAHFDERDFVAIEHHEIDFARAYPVIARNGAKTSANEIALCGALGSQAEFCRARAITAPR
jgi:hypothetical protein